jgi:hypothetical protein
VAGPAQGNGVLSSDAQRVGHLLLAAATGCLSRAVTRDNSSCSSSTRTEKDLPGRPRRVAQACRLCLGLTSRPGIPGIDARATRKAGTVVAISSALGCEKTRACLMPGCAESRLRAAEGGRASHCNLGARSTEVFRRVGPENPSFVLIINRSRC